jgi:hypothetical protein
MEEQCGMDDIKIIPVFEFYVQSMANTISTNKLYSNLDTDEFMERMAWFANTNNTEYRLANSNHLVPMIAAVLREAVTQMSGR